MNLRSEDHFDTINIASAYPGAGKGTLAKCLINHLGANGHEVDYVEVGAIVRTAKNEDVRFRQAAIDYASRGLMVPDEIIVSKIRERIERVGGEKLLLLDGFPRIETQIDPYNEVLQALGRKDVFVYLNVPRRLAELRMIQRGIFERNKGNVPRPEDEDPELRKTRLDLAEADMAPVVESARSKNKLREIDARGSADDVRQAVLKALQGIMPIQPRQDLEKRIA